MYYKLFSAIVLLFLSSLSIFSQSVDEIIEKSMEAQGFKAGVEIKSTIMKMSMQVMGMDMSMTMYMKKPAFRMEQNMMGQDMVTVFDGEKGWMKNPMAGGVQELPKEQVEKMKEQFDFNDMTLNSLKEKGATIEKIGKEKVDGNNCFNLKITMKDGTVSNMFINTSTFLAEKMTTITEGGEGEIYFKDYKKIDCVIMPSLMLIKAQGMEINIKLEDYKCNPKIDDSKFAKPE